MKMYCQLKLGLGLGLLLTISTLITSCSLLAPVKEQQSIYEINSIPHSLAQKRKQAINILVMPPETAFPYNTMQMAYRVKPYQIAYFAQNRWAGTPSQMLKPLIVETLRNTHHYHAVLTAPSLSKYDYVLTSEILELRQDFTALPPLAKIKMRADLTQVTTQKLIASDIFTFSEPLLCNTPYYGVIATNHAVSKLLSRLARFSLRHT